jgi:hypothetical protein
MDVRFKFTRSSRKHGIGRARTKEAMTNAVLVEIQDRGGYHVGMFVGFDLRGLELEIGITGGSDDRPTWLVIHVMPRRYR